MIEKLYSTLQNQAKRDEIDRLVVRAVIERNGKLLYVKRSQSTNSRPGMYEFPGGRIEANETLGQALCREVLEETGLVVNQVIDCLGNCDYIGSQGEQVREFTFYALCNPGTPKVSDEHESFAWFTLPEMYEQPVMDHMKAMSKAFWYLVLFQTLLRDAEKDGINHFAVSAAISNNDTFLVRKKVTEDKDLYSFPRGELHKNENPLDGLIRIIFEQTGLKLSDLVVHLHNNDYVDAHGLKRRQFNFIIEVESFAPLKAGFTFICAKDLEQLSISEENTEITKAFAMIN
jgi:ADP-ribose pyrophosphatase YjhB (NUDIX family)